MELSDQALFEAAAGNQSRVTARESIFIGATVCFEGDRSASPVRVRNISAGGMMIDTAIAHPEGTLVIANLKQIGTVDGRIVWSTEKRIGIAFDTAIDPQKARQKPGADTIQPSFKRPYYEGSRPGLKLR